MQNQKTKVKVALGLFLIFSMSDIFAAGAIMSWKDENGQIHFGDRPPDAANLDDEKVNVIRGSSMFAEPKQETASQDKRRPGMDPNDPDYNNPVNQMKRLNERKRQERIKDYQKNYANRQDRRDSQNSKLRDAAYQQWKEQQRRKEIDNAWAKENGYISPHDKDWKQKVKDKCIKNHGTNCSSEKYLKNHKPVTKGERAAIDQRNFDNFQRRMGNTNGFGSYEDPYKEDTGKKK